MKFLAAIPAVLSAVSFVLTMLALLAGYKKGFMEDYNVMAFNTSTLGHDFLSNLAGSSSSSSTTTSAAAAATTSSKGGFGDLPDPFSVISSLEATATAALGSLESSAASILGDVGDDVADKLADELGIEQFYTVHIMDLCQGDYEPNATASGAWMNVTNCTRAMDFSAMDLSTVLDHELSIGPFNISLSDLGFTDKLTSKLQDLPTIFEALAAIYIISAVFAALTLLASLASIFLLPSGKLVLADLVLALFAALFILVGSLIYTIGAKTAVSKIQDLGAGDIGLEVQVGTKFQALTWASFALMALAAIYWIWEFVGALRARRRERKVRRSKVDGVEMGSPRRGWRARL
ncbi:hypothetical protein N0V82_005512 [Gnomoniopsis sp. IMI 355080]|nr:hypothetical protein N0V82_005512 [Gnomoniopsis sp. IMI 355080]